MLSYLWLMTSPRLVLAGYRLMMLRPCACFTSMYIQSLPTAHSCRDLETCLHILPVILGFLWRELFSDFIFSAPLLPLGLGFAGLWASFSLAHPFTLSVALPLFPAILLCYFCCDVIWSRPAGTLWACYLWLSIVIWAFSIVLLTGSCVPFVFSWHPWPICFPWASLAVFLTLHSHGLFTSLGFPGPIILSFILGTHGPTINPLLSLLALL